MVLAPSGLLPIWRLECRPSGPLERTHVSAWLQSASPHVLRLHGRSEPRPGVQESRSKPGRCGIRSGYFSQERNPVKTFPMRNAVGVFLAMPESIHQAAREGNLPVCDKAAQAVGRKCSLNLVRRAPRVAGEGVRRPPEGSRGVARRASKWCRVAADGDRSFGLVAAG